MQEKNTFERRTCQTQPSSFDEQNLRKIIMNRFELLNRCIERIMEITRSTFRRHKKKNRKQTSTKNSIIIVYGYDFVKRKNYLSRKYYICFRIMPRDSLSG